MAFNGAYVSCKTQQISLLDDLMPNYDKNLQTDLIITDFAKAFEVAPHHRLLYKLNWYGIKDNTFQLIQSFLTNYTQRSWRNLQGTFYGWVAKRQICQ